MNLEDWSRSFLLQNKIQKLKENLFVGAPIYAYKINQHLIEIILSGGKL